MKLQSAYHTLHGFHKSTSAYSFIRDSWDFIPASEEFIDFDKFIITEGIHAMGTRPKITSEVASLTIDRALNTRISNLLKDNSGGHENSTEGNIEVIIREQLQDAFAKANTALFHLREDIPLRPFEGSSAVSVVVYQSQAYIASLGICRAYHFRQGHLTQITQDHSPDGWHVIPGLGHLKSIKVDTFVYPLEIGDRLLLCTPYIWREFANDLLTECLGRFIDPQALVDHLVKNARRQPSDQRDFSALVVDVIE